MKKISISVIMLFATISMFAQTPKYGIKAGLNLSKLTQTNADWRTGFNAGFLAHVHITPSFSLQPEVMYSSQGAKYPNNPDLKRKLDYIDIPLLLQYNFDNGFRLQGGPQVGFLISAKDKLGDVTLNTVSTNNFNAVDFSIPLGLSYLGYSGLGVDARYNLGITNVIKGTTVNVRNSVLQFGLFYLFDHQHKAQTSKRKR
ncbi:MAG: PorT family protein [Bacteroidota bacterium]|nr:PorT family protein [Bacteroidota bacterium]